LVENENGKRRNPFGGEETRLTLFRYLPFRMAGLLLLCPTLEEEGLFRRRVRVIFVPWRWKWWKWKWRDFWCLGFEGWLVIDFYF
jgi:hypothetical protein